jgi:spore coat protein CotH
MTKARATLLALLAIPAMLVAQGTQQPVAPAPQEGAAAKQARGNTDAARARIEAGAARLYDTSYLHQIAIEISEDDARRILARTEERVPVTFTIDGRTLKNVGVRQSGGIYHRYVQIGDKPSLSVKFDEFVPQQKVFDLDKLILKNELQDVSFLSEHITYEIFRRAGLAAPLTAHARVVINGMDVGLYLMREPIDKQFLTRNFGSDAKQGNLYEIENMREFVSNPAAPTLDDEGKDGRNREDLIAFAAAIRSARPDTFVRTLSPMIDIDRLVTYIAAELATDHWDGLTYRNNNVYVYALPTDRGRYVLLPWGADQALGLSRQGLYGAARPMSMLVQQMLSVPALEARVRAETARIRSEPVWNKAVLFERVDRVAKIIAAAGIGSGRTPSDFSRFASMRGAVEAAIRQTNARSLP